MRNLIKKILKESEEFDWVPELKKVIVVVELDVTGAEEFADKYGYFYWNTPAYGDWVREAGSYADSESFLRLKIPSLVTPENGDICYLIEKRTTQGSNQIYRLIRIEDKGEFIIGDHGFKLIN
jgi:hypothetical protein